MYDDKLEYAMQKLEDVFAEQKFRARRLVIEHKQLQDALADFLAHADEDCPSEYRTKHFRKSMTDGYSLLRAVGYFKKGEKNDNNN